MPYTKQSKALNEMLAEVINVRRIVPKEYELKLKWFYAQRARKMEHGIFDGVKLPEVKFNVSNLKENLHRNHELTKKAEYSVDGYLHAKTTQEIQDEALNEMADTLKKVTEIEQIIRNDETY